MSFDDEVAAWRGLGERLGIVVEAPFTLVTARGEHSFVARVAGFGAPQGTLVRASVVDDGAIQAATTAGYGSSHVCVANGVDDIAGIIEMLAEWSWCSDELPPAWLADAHSDAETEHES